jgi:hypothetical protein
MCVLQGPVCPIEIENHLWCDVCNGVIDGNDDDQPRVLVCWSCFRPVDSNDDGITYVCDGCGRTPEEWMAGHGEILQLGFSFADCGKLFGGEVFFHPATFGRVIDVRDMPLSPRPYENEEWLSILKEHDGGDRTWLSLSH